VIAAGWFGRTWTPEDRVRQIGNLTEAQTDIRLELNGMKVELGFIRRALEAKGRADNPFDRENQRPYACDAETSRASTSAEGRRAESGARRAGSNLSLGHDRLRT
jgi:hypothetical protein